MQLLIKLASHNIKLATPVVTPGPVARGLATAASAPVKWVGNMIASAFMGTKATRGPMIGKRLRFAGVKQIDDAAAAKLQHEGKGNLVRKVKNSSGEEMWVKDIFRPGGMVGLAMKHPVISTMGAGGTYVVGSNLMDARKQRLMKQQQSAGQPKMLPTANIRTGAWG